MKRRIGMAGLFIGSSALACFMVIWQQRCIERWKEQAEKNQAMFMLMSQWTRLRQEGRNLEEYFLKKGYKKIAVYGMGILGQRLVKELDQSQVEVAYGIDRNKNIIYSDLKMVSMEDDLAMVDAVVVTVIKGFDAIEEKLLEQIDCPVLAIEDILDEF